MKQLLDTCSLQGHVIVGVGTHVFVLLNQTSKNNTSNPNLNTTGDVGTPIELLIAQPQQDHEAHAMVEAVTCFLDDNNNMLHCAVSRHNKTLSLYTISIKTKESEHTYFPNMVHKTSKRSSGLVFARLENNQHIIILAADLCGDVTAFPILASSSSDDHVDTVISSRRRLMLGHTASMITGIRLVTDYYSEEESTGEKKKIQRILTCDRDGKVRVSSFPNTHIIEGYLLNHESFLSSMDTASGLCITSSGDDTIRLWDYSSLQQLAMFDTRSSSSELTTTANNKGYITNVMIQRNAQMCAFLRDGSFQVHLLHIIGNEKNDDSDNTTLFRLIDRHPVLTCPAQPLYAKFLPDDSILVLIKDPIYLMHFTKNKEGNEEVFEDITAASELCNAMRLVEGKYYEQMPSSAVDIGENGQLKNLPPRTNFSRDKRQLCEEDAGQISKKRLDPGDESTIVTHITLEESIKE